MTTRKRTITTFATAAAALLVLALLGLAGCEGSAGGGQQGAGAGKKGGPGGPGGAKRPVLVVAGTVGKKDVPILVQQPTAKVEPIATVTVRARINGQLDKVHFKEGQEVKEGDLLFTIDKRPLEAELRQAEANMARDKAQAANAQAEAARYEALIERNAVSKSEYEKIVATTKALQASVAANQAAVENAKLQLGFTEIRAPISGQTGVLDVDPGNLVKANDTDLVTINQLSPIYISFSVDEESLPAIRRAMTGKPLAVTAFVLNDPTPEPGTLTFINNTVTEGTGQIQLRGTFPNLERRLWPGQFASVTMELGTQAGATVAPAAAIQTSQDGDFAFVVRPDMTVEQRPVKVDREIRGEDGSEQETIIAEGLKPGERVVTEGHLQLVADSPVELKGEGGARGREIRRQTAATTATTSGATGTMDAPGAARSKTALTAGNARD